MSQINDEQLYEFVTLATDIRVDRDAGLIHGAKLGGPNSKNDRVYSPPAMADLERLYKNKPIRINHDENSYLATVGSIQDVVRNQITEEIHGTLSLNKGHPRYGQIMEDAEHRPHLLQLSHEVPANKYKAHKDPKGHLVIDRVYQVKCLAIVTNGGVNDTLFEGVTEDEHMALKDLAQLKAEYPDLYEEAIAEARQESQNNEKLAKAIAERDAAQTALHEAHEEIAKRDAVAKQEAAKAAIRAKAVELNVQCSDDLMEALLLINEEKATSILKSQPKLKEDEVDGEHEGEKPKQRGGLTQKTRGYVSRTEWISRFANGN